ncbi:hypothetical protein DPMN_078496 [Dreissena polymorpha]|uniref:Uncharacterized protein n=1 Tax=Dreissena polymorpha TaxID=45954 RepID=A0A9D3YR82_DREPO|nr:hypothetical protein DPMN_078496 [Dreissena polymorpha]
MGSQSASTGKVSQQYSKGEDSQENRMIEDNQAYSSGGSQSGIQQCEQSVQYSAVGVVSHA